MSGNSPIMAMWLGGGFSLASSSLGCLQGYEPQMLAILNSDFLLLSFACYWKLTVPANIPYAARAV